MASILNTKNKKHLATRAAFANSFVERLKGLLGEDELAEGEALVIDSCQMVHMFFMRFPIDVLFCSESGVVLSCQRDLKPWRISKFVRGAKYAIELPAGTIKAMDVRPGDELSIT